ncbi:MAG: T9SS type A sorting domain-containing protein [Algicola sp.]|nr:T9SS type A sorting domain-containing protein [Algicola sp.]
MTQIKIILLSLLLYTNCSIAQTCGYDSIVGLINFKDYNSYAINDPGLIDFYIPVVFHVIYNSDNDNIHDSVILNQLDILNECFFFCEDTIRDQFKEIVACPRILFYLASSDPYGKSTSGITRNYTYRKSFNSSDSIYKFDTPKYKIYGGVDAWDTDRYLNIWVCNLESLNVNNSSLLGYAFPPTYAKNWDQNSFVAVERQGVVMSNKAIGSNNPFGNPQYSKTLVHEMGHYFGLKHIWGDKTSDCNDDDGIDDTPLSSNPSFSCSLSKNTCESGMEDLPDMIENAMDYAPSSCSGYFTKGQVQRITINLLNFRPKLYSAEPREATEIRFEIFPNPAQSVFFIYNNSLDIRNRKYEIFNSNGVLVYKTQSAERKVLIKIPSSNLSNGIYYVRVHSESKVEVKKVFINSAF